MGAAVGRFANRIGGAQFPLYEEIVHVTPNQNGNCLHSGLHGFNHTVFDVEPTPPGERGQCDDDCAQRRRHRRGSPATWTWRSSISW